MYALVNQYRDNQGVMTLRYVYTGFTSRAQAEEWNQVSFASPEWNEVVPMSHVSEVDPL